jgi:hypothetical protein
LHPFIGWFSTPCLWILNEIIRLIKTLILDARVLRFYIILFLADFSNSIYFNQGFSMLRNSEALFISNMELVSKFRITVTLHTSFYFWTFRTSLGRWCSMNCHTRITLSSIDHPSSSFPLLDCRQKKYSFGCFKNLCGQPPGSFKAYVKYLLFSFEMLVLRFAFLPFSLLNFSIEVFCPRLLCLIITLSFCSNLLKTCLKTFVSITTREVIKDHMSWSRNTRNQTRNQRLNRF